MRQLVFLILCCCLLFAYQTAAVAQSPGSTRDRLHEQIERTLSRLTKEVNYSRRDPELLGSCCHSGGCWLCCRTGGCICHSGPAGCFCSGC